MQKLQQQLSDTSGLERGGGLAVVLANYWGEWTTFNGNLEDGEFTGLQFCLGVVDITLFIMSVRVYCHVESNGEIIACGHTLATKS